MALNARQDIYEEMELFGWAVPATNPQVQEQV